MKMLPIHDLAKLFPTASKDDRARMRESLEKDGLLEDIVTLDGKILEGVNRASILINDLKTEPTYRDFNDLPETNRRIGPLRFVAARNLPRRHLTQSQKAAVAAKLVPLFKAEAKERQGSRTDLSSASADANVNGKGGKATGAAAEIVGASQTSVERAVRLQKEDPAAFEAVHEGKTTLGKALSDRQKKADKQAELETAIKRIRVICGRAMADAIEEGSILKTAHEVKEYANLSSEDMLKCKGLIGTGWKVAVAKRYKMTQLTARNTIGELAIRALALGGKFSMQIKHSGVTLEISVRKAPEKNETTG